MPGNTNAARHSKPSTPPTPSVPDDRRRREPPRQPRSSSSPESSTSSVSFKGCFCCLLILISLLALISLIVFVVIFFALKPKKPEFDLQQVGVQFTSPPPSAASDAPPTVPISLTITMVFAARNPNKVGIKYGDSGFTVMYRGIPLGRAVVPAFYQVARSVRRVVATIAVDRFSLMLADAGDMVRDASLNDRVELTVRGDVSAKIRVMKYDSPSVQVSVNCGIVISPKNQSLTYKQCGFDGFNV